MRVRDGRVACRTSGALTPSGRFGSAAARWIRLCWGRSGSASRVVRSWQDPSGAQADDRVLKAPRTASL
jgi:hypothetical protein